MVLGFWLWLLSEITAWCVWWGGRGRGRGDEDIGPVI